MGKDILRVTIVEAQRVLCNRRTRKEGSHNWNQNVSRERLKRKAHSAVFRARTWSGKRDPRLCEGHAQIPKTYSNRAHFNRKLLLTTLTLLKAIAAPAIIGFNKNPLIG